MTKEIPLSLQVFHSFNEYQAQRLNRTEQLRLKDLHDVLKREEKLYVKYYALNKQRFHSHYLRRQSDPAGNLSNGGIGRNCFSSTSLCSRTSVFSAPAKLQTARTNSVDSSLTSRMCNSFGEITTMTRFKRVQRKLSLASFTENGLLTPKGAKMSKNIDKARDILFKTKSTTPKQGSGMNTIGLNQVVEENRIAEEENEMTEDIQKRNDAVQHGVKHTRNHGNIKESLAIHEINGGEPSSELENQTSREKKLLNDSLGAIDEESQNIDSTDTRQRSSSSSSSSHATNNSNIRSIFQNNIKKRVTISSNCDSNRSGERESTQPDFVDNEDVRSSTALLDEETSRAFNEWKSRFSRQAKQMNPLQQKINLFLSDQTDFNRAFPKHYESAPQPSALQKELAAIGKEKSDLEKRERRKKNEIVLEVLGKLGIDDDNIVSIYKE